MGWEIVSDKLTFTVKDTQLPKAFPVRGMVERVSLDSEDFHNVYSYFAMQHHGALIRDRLAWDEYWRWENDDMIVALYYNEEHKPLGYLVYYIANEIFHIKEMVYLTSEARHGLWNYISAHFSMITQVRGDNYSGEPMAYLFEDSEIEETIAPYIMARIVDVESFLQEYPWQIQPEDFKIHFRVTDGLASWNQGDFLVSWHEGETTCERVEDNQSINVVELDINTLTALMMGYKRPTYLYDHEKISMEYYMQECGPGTPTQKRYRAQNLFRLFLHVVSDISLFLCRLNLIKQLRASNCRRMRNNRAFRLLCAHAADRLFDLVGKALLRRRICEFFLQHSIRPI